MKRRGRTPAGNQQSGLLGEAPRTAASGGGAHQLKPAAGQWGGERAALGIINGNKPSALCDVGTVCRARARGRQRDLPGIGQEAEKTHGRPSRSREENLPVSAAGEESGA